MKNRNAFAPLVNELKFADAESYSASVLALINCIILSHDDLQERIQVRSRFISQYNTAGCGIVSQASLHTYSCMAFHQA